MTDFLDKKKQKQKQDVFTEGMLYQEQKDMRMSDAEGFPLADDAFEEKDLRQDFAEFESHLDEYQQVFDKERPTVFFDKKKFPNTSGEQCFLLSDGRKTKRGIPYKLEGWIGIHSSIDKEFASRNDSRYLRNKVYQPNKLRLYVRKNWL